MEKDIMIDKWVFTHLAMACTAIVALLILGSFYLGVEYCKDKELFVECCCGECPAE